MKQVKIIITNQKGGVGKSTIASNLAGYFSAHHHKKISFIDFDRQASGATLIKKIHDPNIGVYKKELFLNKAQIGVLWRQGKHLIHTLLVSTL